MASGSESEIFSSNTAVFFNLNLVLFLFKLLSIAYRKSDILSIDLISNLFSFLFKFNIFSALSRFSLEAFKSPK